MRSNRVITIAVLVGLVGIAVTFLGAAKMSGDDAPGAESKSVTNNNSGVLVVFASIGRDNGIDQLSIFPDAFPQACKVVKVYVKEGQSVKKGDKLLECDTELADLTVDEARFALQKAEAELKRTQAMLQTAEQKLKGHGYLVDSSDQMVMSKKLLLNAAEIDLKDKEKKAAGVGASNDPELLAARKKLEAAEKDLRNEEIKLDGLKQLLPTSLRDEAQAGVAEATAAVNMQKVLLSKAQYGLKLMTLKAPVDGKVVKAMVTEGMTFGPQSKAPAFFMETEGPLVARAEVDQEWAWRVTKGLDAKIEDDSNSKQTWQGKVQRVADSFMAKRITAGIPEGLTPNETRVLECIIGIDNVASGPPLRVGQRVKVIISKPSEKQAN